MPLFYHSGALGDFLLSLPLLRALRRAFPGEDWTVVAPEGHARLVSSIFPFRRRGTPGLLEFAPLSRSGEDVAGLRDLVFEHGALFGFVRDAERIEAIVRGMPAGRPSAFSEPLAWTTARGEEIEVTVGKTIAKIEPLARPLGPADFSLSPRELPPPPPAEALQVLDRSGERQAALLYVGASHPSRMAPPSLTTEVARRLESLGWMVAWAQGPIEEERGFRPPPGLALDCPDLVLLAHVLSRVGLCIGNNTGPMHLSAQLGTPTLALHGIPDPLWRLRGMRARTIGGRVGFPGVEDVMGAVDEVLASRNVP